MDPCFFKTDFVPQARAMFTYSSNSVGDERPRTTTSPAEVTPTVPVRHSFRPAIHPVPGEEWFG